MKKPTVQEAPDPHGGGQLAGHAVALLGHGDAPRGAAREQHLPGVTEAEAVLEV